MGKYTKNQQAFYTQQDVVTSCDGGSHPANFALDCFASEICGYASTHRPYAKEHTHFGQFCKGFVRCLQQRKPQGEFKQ